MDHPHVGDIGTIIYLPTYAGGVPLGATLELFTLRTVRLQRPRLVPLIEIIDVPTAVDPLDDVLKLQLITGSDEGISLSGVGNFALLAVDVGEWLAEISLGNLQGYWTMGPFPLFTLVRTMA